MPRYASAYVFSITSHSICVIYIDIYKLQLYHINIVFTNFVYENKEVLNSSMFIVILSITRLYVYLTCTHLHTRNPRGTGHDTHLHTRKPWGTGHVLTYTPERFGVLDMYSPTHPEASGYWT